MFKFIKRFFSKEQTAWPDIGGNTVDILSVVSAGHPERGDLTFRVKYKYNNEHNERLFVAAQKGALDYKMVKPSRVCLLTPHLAEKILMLRLQRKHDIGKYSTFQEWLCEKGPEMKEKW